MEFFDRYVMERARLDAAQTEAACRKIARSYIPRPLRWLADHPRLLKLIYRVRPAWRPEVTIGFDAGALGDATTTMVRSKDGTVYVCDYTVTLT